MSSPYVKKKLRNSLLESRYDKKSIEKEFNKRSTSKSPSDKAKSNSENRIALLEERKKRLKEIAHNSENLHNTKGKTAKHTAKVKSSSSRGTFLLEGCFNTQKISGADSLPSTSKCSRKKNFKVQTEEREIQDTTVTSNFSPKNDDEKLEYLTKPIIHISHNLHKGPDSTVTENRSGVIWRKVSNISSTSIKNVQKNITIDDIICKIVHWSVKWLMEQNNIDRSPPINGEVQPKEMPLNFSSFIEYNDTVTALTMLELWQYVYQMLYNKDEER